jgi:hypothetical protein
MDRFMTRDSEVRRVINVLHVRSNTYTSVAATGVIATGPTDDGFMHLHFFREMQRILNEEVPVEQTGSDDLVVHRDRASMKVHLQREEVATVSIPTAIFGRIVGNLQALADELYK